jgi:DNA-binding transcriptional ArsR family regulator
VTDTVSDTTESTVDTASNTTGQTSDALTNTTDSGSLLTVDGDTGLLSADTDDGSSATGEASDGSAFSDELADVTGALTGGLTETTTTAVSGVTETTDTVVGEDGLLTTVGDTLVSGTTLETTDDTTLSALGDGSATTPAGDSTVPGDGSSADAEASTPAPSGGSGATGTLASLASQPVSGSIPVTGQAAAGAGLAVGAAAAAGTVLLRGSAVTGTGAGRSVARVARYGGANAVRRAGAGVLDRLFRIATFFRYSRYDDSDPLENEARAAVMDAVEADPGRPITEVAAAADVNLSTARYHVRVLQKEDMLMRVAVRGRKRLFPAFTQDPELLAALSDEATAPLIDALRRLEPASVGALADELGKSPSTVTHHLQRLEDDGVVVRERAGRAVENSLAPTTREALAPSAEPETEATPPAQRAD